MYKIGNVCLDETYYPGEDLYSDGAVEERLLELAEEYGDGDCHKAIVKEREWAVMYHLAHERGNILSWYPFGEGAKILEVGSGCGAVTGALAARAGSVTCIDLSKRRSTINAQRNRERDNINIYIGNFQDIEKGLEKDFDYATLIGVFEYGQGYIGGERPYHEFLTAVMGHIKPGGKLLLAIENKFGLKYWAGCKEDHVGTYFSGLEGYPEGGSARTFTRAGLEKILKACGVSNYSFYYPYPDYKFPTAIYSDRRLPGTGELTDNLRNFDRDRMLLFNEKYVFDSVLQDKLFDVFSNSYLVVIGKEPDTCYVKYSNDRAPEFTLRTDIVDTENGRVVRKIPCAETARGHVRGMKRSYELLKERYEGSGLAINECLLPEGKDYAEFPYEKGVLLEELLDECLAKDDMEGFHRLFDKYYELISYGEEKAVTDYDLVFGNILVDGEQWKVIDYEWTMGKHIPAKEVAFRAIYCYVLEEEKRNKLNLDLILDKLDITEKAAEEYRERERKFQKKVTGRRKSMGEIRAGLGTYSVDAKLLMENHLKKILDERIQVYFDYGNGFREEDSVYMPDVYTKEGKIFAKIPVDGNVAALRIDPADRPCMVRITELSLSREPVPFQKKNVEVNGKTIKSGCYVFDTSDPNIHIKLAGLSRTVEDTLTIEMEISTLTAEMARAMMGAVKKLF